MHPVGKKNAQRTPHVPAASTGKLPEVKRTHEARLQALRELTEVLHETFGGDEKEAASAADTWLRRVSGPELDLTHLSAQECDFVENLPAEAWRTLQRYAQTSTEAGITSVCLSSNLDMTATLMHGLAQLHVQHLALGYPVMGISRSRLEGRLPFLEHVSERWGAGSAPEYAALLEPSAQAAEHSEPVANIPPRTVRKKRAGQRLPSVAPNDRVLQTRLSEAMERGDCKSTRPAVAAILGAKLGPQLTLQLLMSRAALEPAARTAVAFPPTKIFVPQLSAFVEDDDEEQRPPEQTATPILGRLCGQLGPAQHDPRHPGYRTVSAYLEEIVNSRLPAQDKRTICASAISTPQGPVTAARLAMQEGHPVAVARMMLAVIESGVAHNEKLELVAAFEVSQEEIDAAFSSPALLCLPQLHKIKALWQDCWEAMALLGGDARVTLKSSSEPIPVVMRAERMWTRGSGQVLCSSSRELPHLDWRRIPDDNPRAAGRFFYALDPGWLKPEPAAVVAP